MAYQHSPSHGLHRTASKKRHPLERHLESMEGLRVVDRQIGDKISRIKVSIGDEADGHFSISVGKVSRGDSPKEHPFVSIRSASSSHAQSLIRRITPSIHDYFGVGASEVNNIIHTDARGPPTARGYEFWPKSSHSAVFPARQETLTRLGRRIVEKNF